MLARTWRFISRLLQWWTMLVRSSCVSVKLKVGSISFIGSLIGSIVVSISFKISHSSLLSLAAVVELELLYVNLSHRRSSVRVVLLCKVGIARCCGEFSFFEYTVADSGSVSQSLFQYLLSWLGVVRWVGDC